MKPCQIADAIAMHAAKGQCHIQLSLTVLYICPFLEEYWTARCGSYIFTLFVVPGLGSIKPICAFVSMTTITIRLFEAIPDSAASTPARWVARPHPASIWCGWYRARCLCSV